MTSSANKLNQVDDSCTDSIPVTVIILTRNEEINIRKCVSALHEFSDIVVVDSGSTDRTLSILETDFPNVRVFSNPFDDFGQQRTWAIKQTEPKHNWILFIDADEYMEAPLSEEIREFVVAPEEFVGAFIAGRNYFFGKWLKYCTYYPSYQLRLLKRGEVEYRQEGHGQREVTSGKLTYFKKSWHHEAMSHGVTQWIDRHNRYSSDEIGLILRLRNEKTKFAEIFARDAIQRRRALKKLAAKLPCRPFTRFLYTYFLKLGFLDGYAGWVFCFLRFSHDWHIIAKLTERRLHEKSNN